MDNLISMIPGPCQRLRLPSLTTMLKFPTRNNCANSQVCKQKRRVVFMGSARVGKTCIINQFLYDQYHQRYKKTVEEMHVGEYDTPDGSMLVLEILDTSGSYTFPAMRALSITTSDAFILVYAIDDLDSWYEVESLRKQVSINFEWSEYCL
ncbi:GTP-binding protein Rhes-like [Teleopsis dalmanni]|uniref:GTP-binding protein Rhes-like n=1 Tax=Teleopsis dalmanni TaxID=139649 RepID=UPI0018CDB491|nr:GTP-binding protein Rhes-like [Teleopsis dalmanni]